MIIQHILEILSQIAKKLNEGHITWAVGGSLLLYFKGIVDEFHDIDLMVHADDAEEAKSLLMEMGELQKPAYENPYKADHFYVFLVEDVEVDLMGGFTILKADGEHRCFLRKEDIYEKVLVDGEQIPLHSLTEWRRYYELMGRSAKVKMIDDAEKNMEDESK